MAVALRSCSPSAAPAVPGSLGRARRTPPRCLGRIRQKLCSTNNSSCLGRVASGLRLQKHFLLTPNCTDSTSSDGSREEPSSSSEQSKTPFGYTRKDVLLIGLGTTVIGVGLKSGLEFFGVDPLQSGNVVQLVIVLGLMVGWISTYMFRVASKDMTYAQQLRDYENKVMQKRLESLSEAELEVLLEQVEEEKGQLASGDQVK